MADPIVLEGISPDVFIKTVKDTTREIVEKYLAAKIDTAIMNQLHAIVRGMVISELGRILEIAKRER